MKYDVTIRVHADNATEAIGLVQSPDFYYEEIMIVSAQPVKEEL